MIRVSATGWRERRKCGLLELEIFNEIARDQGQPLSILQDLGLLAPSPILRFIIDFSTSFVLMTPKIGPVIRTQYRQCLINFEKGESQQFMTKESVQKPQLRKNSARGGGGGYPPFPLTFFR